MDADDDGPTGPRSNSGYETETGSGDGAGLARHSASKPLALQGGRQVHVAVAGEEAGEEFHDTAPCRGLHGVPSLGLGVGHLVDDADIDVV